MRGDQRETDPENREVKETEMGPGQSPVFSQRSCQFLSTF